MNNIFLLLSLLCLYSCALSENKDEESASSQPINVPHLVVLGIAQDAGYPQADCQKKCCADVWGNIENRKMVSCLGLVNPSTNESWIFDATPDFKDQLQALKNINTANKLAGIFLTHAHIGHYTGLMHLGREVMGAKHMPVYAMPRMKEFLSSNGPWSQLVKLNNIQVNQLDTDSTIQLTKELAVRPLLVPHRDEFSETVGYLIEGTQKKVLFIPDIDKWHLWKTDIVALIKEVNFAFLDGTFFQNGEIKGRDMSEIPHPFVEESMDLFETLSDEDKAKVHFIHFNHTNPLLREGSEAQQKLNSAGFNVAKELQSFQL